MKNKFIFIKPVKIGVVEGPTHRIGDDCILALAHIQGGGIVGKDMLKKGKRVCAPDEKAPHMRNIKQSGFFSGGQMFPDNAGFVLQGHLPAAEFNHLGTEADMAVIKDSFLNGFHPVKFSCLINVARPASKKKRQFIGFTFFPIEIWR